MTLAQFFKNMAAMAAAIEALPNPPGTPPVSLAPDGSQWRTPPYFTPGPQVEVATTSSSGVPAETLTVDSYLQSMLASTMSFIRGYLNPAYQTGLTSRTAAAIVNNYIITAQGHATAYPSTGVGIDLVALGTTYGNLQVKLMQEIDSGPLGGKPGVSVFDAWTALGA